ncbi:MAG: hypothetical protein ACYDH3_00030 [Candidatus Aminicenantales bacterium]
MTDQGKNNTRIVLAALAIVTTVIMYVLVPIARGNTSNSEILQRLARLEECTRKIETLPERVSALTEAVNGLKDNSVRMEKKLDSHVDKDK